MAFGEEESDDDFLNAAVQDQLGLKPKAPAKKMSFLESISKALFDAIPSPRAGLAASAALQSPGSSGLEVGLRGLIGADASERQMRKEEAVRSRAHAIDLAKIKISEMRAMNDSLPASAGDDGAFELERLDGTKVWRKPKPSAIDAILTRGALSEQETKLRIQAEKERDEARAGAEKSRVELAEALRQKGDKAKQEREETSKRAAEEREAARGSFDSAMKLYESETKGVDPDDLIADKSMVSRVAGILRAAAKDPARAERVNASIPEPLRRAAIKYLREKQAAPKR